MAHPTRALSPSHTHPWPPCGSLPSTACFSTRTRPYPVTLLTVSQTIFAPNLFPYKYRNILNLGVPNVFALPLVPPWYVSSRQIHDDLGVPLFADDIKALTASFDSKLDDLGNPLVRQLGRYLR